MAATETHEPEREHELSKDCWCNPTVEHVPAKGKTA